MALPEVKRNERKEPSWDGIPVSVNVSRMDSSIAMHQEVGKLSINGKEVAEILQPLGGLAFIISKPRKKKEGGRSTDWYAIDLAPIIEQVYKLTDEMDKVENFGIQKKERSSEIL